MIRCSFLLAVLSVSGRVFLVFYKRYKKGAEAPFKWILFVVYDLSEIWFQGSATYKTAIDVSLSE